MLNFHRAEQLLAMIAPSVPRPIRAQVIASQTPMPANPPAGMGHTPEGEDGSPAAEPQQQRGSEPKQRRTSPSGPPTVELFQTEPIHPAFRYELDDRRIATWPCWATEEQA